MPGAVAQVRPAHAAAADDAEVDAAVGGPGRRPFGDVGQWARGRLQRVADVANLRGEGADARQRRRDPGRIEGRGRRPAAKDAELLDGDRHLRHAGGAAGGGVDVCRHNLVALGHLAKHRVFAIEPGLSARR